MSRDLNMHRSDDGDEDGEDPGTDDDRWWKGGMLDKPRDDGWNMNGSGGCVGGHGGGEDQSVLM